MPGDVSLPNRNLMNLLEMPVLFYAVCVGLFVIGAVDAAALWLSCNVALLVLWARFALALK